MKKLLRQHKGFTLIELMVVVSILAVLAAIVSGGVVGTKSRGEVTQAQSDAQATQQAASMFNNTSRLGQWPEGTIQLTTPTYLFDSRAITYSWLTQPAFAVDAGNNVTNFSYVSWSMSADVRTTAGGIATATFVPDFLLQKPDSTRFNRGADPEYIWLFKKGSVFSDQGRAIQVWKLNDAGTAYEKIFPKVTN